MKVVLFCGGLGTRLREAVPEVPKVLAPVAGRPFLLRLLDQLEAQGVEEVVIASGYQAGLVEGMVGEGHGTLRVRFSREGGAGMGQKRR